MVTFPQLSEKFVCSCWFSNLGILPIIPKEPFTIIRPARERGRDQSIIWKSVAQEWTGDRPELILPLGHLPLIINELGKILTFATNILN